jgi:peptidoglycan/xylan/chitin deacetylase (PgdA/CDA1 family)
MSKRSIVFLMYHELALAGRRICQNDPGYARYVLSQAEFSHQLEFLNNNQWRGLSVGEALAFPAARCVAITFDDGCETDVLAAAPILRLVSFNATFFITSGKLGAPGYLSVPQLRELSSLGFEIGCHSMTHAYLTDLDEAGLRREIVEAKDQLEQIVGQTVEHFSCPGGRYDQRVLKLARSAGYKTVSTSRIHANSEKTDPFTLGRIAVLRDLSLSDFAAICEGRSLPGMRLGSGIRHAAKRILGNAVYDRIRAKVLDRADPPT